MRAVVFVLGGPLLGASRIHGFPFSAELLDITAPIAGMHPANADLLEHAARNEVVQRAR